MLPFVDLSAQRARIQDELDAAIGRVLAHGQFILGPEVEALEGELARFCGARNCIACANGTDALTLALMAEAVGPGDAVFVPSFTFVATAETVAEQRATPVFVDVHAETFNLDVDSLVRAVEGARAQGLRPRMVIAVDLFGQPADYPRIQEVARAHDLVLVADAAQSFGARCGNRRVGTLAAYTATSFYPVKPLGCYGDGGAVFTDDDDKAALLRSLRYHGMGETRYDNVRIGVNSRLDTLQAAILLVKLRIFADEIDARQTVAQRYGARLNGIRAPRVARGASSVWAQYTVRLPREAARDAVQARCRDAGVPTAVYYPIPLHLQSGYRGYPCDPLGLPCTEAAAAEVLSLPMHPYLESQDQDRVVEALLEAIAAGRP